ncbi:MAG: PAS domain-containing protein [Spirochaetaceae bacterium]
MSGSHRNEQVPQFPSDGSVNPGARSRILLVTSAPAAAPSGEPAFHLPPDRFEVLTATDRDGALALLREHTIDAVVSDLTAGAPGDAERVRLARQLCEDHDLPLLLLADPAAMDSAFGLRRMAAAPVEPEPAEAAPADTGVTDSRTFMDAVMESAQEGINVLDADLTIRRTNRKIQQWYAASMPLEGKKCYEAFHGRSTPCERCPTLRCMQTGALEREVIPARADSEVDFVELFSYPVKDRITGEVIGVIEFVRDITDERRNEERLRRTKERAEQFLNVAATIILSLKPDGTILLLNDSGHRLLGHEPGTLTGANWYDTAVPQRYRPEVRDHLQGLASGRGDLGPTHENPVMTRSGEERTILWHNTIVTSDDGDEPAILSSGEDITERIRLEERMERRLAYEEAMTAASRVLGDPAGDLTGALHPLLSATKAGRTYVFRNSLSDGDGELTMSQVAEVCAAGVSSQLNNPALQELPYSALDPSVRHELGRGRVFMRRVEELREADRSFFEGQDISQLLLIPVEGGGEWIGFLGFDVCDEPRRWEQEDIDLLRSAAAMIGNTLVRWEAESEIKSLLEEKELLLREVHHRVKNNMHSMQSLLSLQAQMVENPGARAALQEARSRLQAMDVLYDKLYRSGNVLTISAREYLSSLIDEAVRLTNASADLRVTTDIPDLQLPVRTLSTLGLLINELVTNSVKHAFPAGTAGTISVTLEVDSDVLLHYRDSGIGIPDEVLSGTSAGLGMVLIGSMTQQLEGTMEISRRKGSCFVFRFPGRIADLPAHAKRQDGRS